MGKTQIWFEKIDKYCKINDIMLSIADQEAEEIIQMIKELIDNRPSPRDYILEILEANQVDLNENHLVPFVKKAFDDHKLEEYEKARTDYSDEKSTVPNDAQIRDFLGKNKTVAGMQSASYRTQEKTRKRVLDYCIGLNFTLEQTQRMLEQVLLVSGLNPKDPLEAVIYYVLKSRKNNMPGMEIKKWMEKYDTGKKYSIGQESRERKEKYIKENEYIEEKQDYNHPRTVILKQQLEECKNDIDFWNYLKILRKDTANRTSASELYNESFKRILIETNEWDEIEDEYRKERKYDKNNNGKELKNDKNSKNNDKFIVSNNENNSKKNVKFIVDGVDLNTGKEILIPEEVVLSRQRSIDSKKWISSFFDKVLADYPKQPEYNDADLMEIEYLREIFKQVPFGHDSIIGKLDGSKEVFREDLLILISYRYLMKFPPDNYNNYRDIILPFRNEVAEVMNRTGMHEELYVRNPFELFLYLCLIIQDVDYLMASWYMGTRY